MIIESQEEEVRLVSRFFTNWVAVGIFQHLLVFSVMVLTLLFSGCNRTSCMDGIIWTNFTTFHLEVAPFTIHYPTVATGSAGRDCIDDMLRHFNVANNRQGFVRTIYFDDEREYYLVTDNLGRAQPRESMYVFSKAKGRFTHAFVVTDY